MATKRFLEKYRQEPVPTPLATAVQDLDPGVDGHPSFLDSSYDFLQGVTAEN